MDQKELDNQRKKQKEQIDKLKEDEMNKIRAQKKILEQRQKNITLTNTSSKRERDEIESLRKQLVQLREEMN